MRMIFRPARIISSMAKSLIAGNRRGILILSLLIGVSVITRSQDSCPHGSADEAANALEKALLSAKSCKAAAGKLWNCAWGSSADVGFAGIVIEKCQKTFLPKLSSAAEQSYRDQMEMCNYEYERQGGTMSRSFTSLCHVDLAAAFAANLPLASRPVARASFDCDKAQTVLERTICSDVRL